MFTSAPLPKKTDSCRFLSQTWGRLRLCCYPSSTHPLGGQLTFLLSEKKKEEEGGSRREKKLLSAMYNIEQLVVWSFKIIEITFNMSINRITDKKEKRPNYKTFISSRGCCFRCIFLTFWPWLTDSFLSGGQVILNVTRSRLRTPVLKEWY